MGPFPPARLRTALTFPAFDLVAQALAKVERGHAQALGDRREVIARGLVEASALRQACAAIEPPFFRYSALDPASFRARRRGVGA